MGAPDALRAWLAVRETVPWDAVRPPAEPAAGPLVPVRDGAAHDIGTVDRARSPERADGMLAALDRVRADAAAGARPTFDLLQGWQRHVLGGPAPPRTGAAFAKAGRERYGLLPDLRERLDACLGQATGPAPPLAARAARAYLDVCFFHPFEDGNGRSAFLTLVFLLAREGVALDQVGPLRRVARYADDPRGALALADLLAVLIDAARRRAVRPGRPAHSARR
ncbi:Fic family protein [Nocardiopsis protaetiae]|uniref:Fic family protein n=1 Tax=Nocardiopsis protaetiae TaxID=3382270 RepID=UPI00387B579E